jgi:hypothetical protein
LVGEENGEKNRMKGLEEEDMMEIWREAKDIARARIWAARRPAVAFLKM